jgi:hypothetical protein
VLREVLCLVCVLRVFVCTGLKYMSVDIRVFYCGGRGRGRLESTGIGMGGGGFGARRE